MRRCLLISEIFCVVLEFIRQYDGLPEDGECKEGRKLGTRTLASLARTCRAFSAPALDLLWMRLDSLHPLIKALPSRIWAKKTFPLCLSPRSMPWHSSIDSAQRLHCPRTISGSLPSSSPQPHGACLE
ncbi:hypothetical protein JVT61DRAFT_11922 [Boletus reticuloceps]|uniref:Secreted protein n=1 Tax=Boletus reticuloceps TaxID=495285 RepID=A0A8I3AEH1_9AGAM|nr:hypothetical protein JVT61DRAFT_11922 [Boletus reticuloceps]